MRTIRLMAAAAGLAAIGIVPAAAHQHGMHKAQAASGRTIVDVAAGNEDFSTLVTAVKAADLATTLSGRGPFTVFAPTNAAFAKLPAGTVETLTQPANKATLSGILTYHVVSGRYPSTRIAALIRQGGGSATLTTVQGGTLTARLDGSAVVLTDAKGGTSRVTTTDLNASNGVIHVIDTVVMP